MIVWVDGGVVVVLGAIGHLFQFFFLVKLRKKLDWDQLIYSELAVDTRITSERDICSK